MKNDINRLKLCLLAAIICALHLDVLSKDSKAATHWNQFRGPKGDGTSASSNLPIEFSGTKNICWRTAIHDLGWSSPVVWGSQIWLTTARTDGSELFAVCVDLKSGRVLHDIRVFEVNRAQTEHGNLNTHATPTPVIEEGRIYVHFGTYGTACLDTKTGKKLWERRDLNCDHRVRPASSPIIGGDLLFLTYDGVDQQFIAALEKETGKTRWLKKRSYESNFEAVLKAGGVDDVESVKKEKPGDNRKSYATPTIIENEGKKQLISPAAEATYSYDPATGKELWFIRHKGWGWNVSSRPIYRHGLVYLTTGIGKNLVAVRPTGSGDVTETHVVWSTHRGASHIPSPLVVGDLLFTVSDQGGMATCIEAESGKQIWKERLDGGRSHWCSPLYTDGKIYFFSKEGDVTVIAAKREFKVLARNEFDAGFIANPAIAGEALILRAEGYLYYVAKGYEIDPLPKVAAKSKSDGSGKGGKVYDGDLDAFGRQLKAAVDSGKMTEAEAIAKWKEAVAGKGGAKRKGSKKGKGEVDLKKLAQQLKVAVVSGKMTQKEAFEKLATAVAGKQPAQKDKPAKVNLDELGRQLKEAVASGKMTEEEAIAKYKKAWAAQGGGKVKGAKGVKGGAKGGFYSIVVGRLKSKDIELGEFTMEVDYATLNRYTSKWVKDEIMGKTVKVSGISGKFRDNLLLIKKGQTLKVRTESYSAQSNTLSFAHKFNVLERAAPFDLEAHGVPPEEFRGFEGVLQGKIIEVGGYEVMMEVEKVLKVDDGNKAARPKSIKGKRVRLAGFYQQHEKLFKELRSADIIRIGARHEDPVFDMFQVQGELVKIEQ